MERWSAFLLCLLLPLWLGSLAPEYPQKDEFELHFSSDLIGKGNGSYYANFNHRDYHNSQSGTSLAALIMPVDVTMNILACKNVAADSNAWGFSIFKEVDYDGVGAITAVQLIVTTSSSPVKSTGTADIDARERIYLRAFDSFAGFPLDATCVARGYFR